MTPIPRLRDYQGPAILSYGFRPFFLLSALYAGLAMLVWLPFLQGHLSVPTDFSPRDWHVHEMVYGYLPGVVTGFLLTAIPNWTGRLPLQGRPLLVLVLAWVAGRVAISTSAHIGWAMAALIDAAFLVLVPAAAAREIIAGQNWRNLKVLLLVLLLLAGNVGFHIEAHARGSADYSVRVGLAAIVMLIVLIGGRIVPSFTRNWLAREKPGRLPAAFGRFDMVAMALAAIGLGLWIIVPTGPLTGGALLLAGVAHTIRLARWAGERTLSNMLVFVLHLGYAFVPIGFLLLAAAAFDLVAASAGMHAWGGGAAGVMTLAVMTRASLGHTGRPLVATRATIAIYAAVALAALVRVAAALEPDLALPLLSVSATAWTAAFLGFGAAYGPLLLQPRGPA